jgi:putative transposase
MQVTTRGFRAWRVRPASQRQRDDMVLLAHIREQDRLSLQCYGRPWMTEDLQELGLKVGHRRVGL